MCTIRVQKDFLCKFNRLKDNEMTLENYGKKKNTWQAIITSYKRPVQLHSPL